MNPEKLLNDLEKTYGNKRCLKRDGFNKRPALPAEIKEVIDKAKENGDFDSDQEKQPS